MQQRWMIVGLGLVLAVGCKEKSKKVAEPAVVVKQPASDDDFRAKASLTATEQGGAFVVTDGAGKVKLTLPSKPTFSGDTARDGSVEVFNAMAVMAGGDGAVDVSFGVVTARDGDMPRELIDMITGAPEQLAQAAGGKVEKNEAGKLAGQDARVFELTTPDGRRLFGWHVIASAQGRMYQINCVGTDTPKSRTACETIAKSLTLS